MCPLLVDQICAGAVYIIWSWLYPEACMFLVQSEDIEQPWQLQLRTL